MQKKYIITNKGLYKISFNSSILGLVQNTYKLALRGSRCMCCPYQSHLYPGWAWVSNRIVFDPTLIGK